VGLIEETLFNQFIRRSWRYNAMLALPLAMLGAIAMAALATRLRPATRGALAAGVAAVILIDLPLPPLDGRDIVLSLGLYDELTGERLALRGAAAQGSDSADALQIRLK
jgi:hypothetical protein